MFSEFALNFDLDYLRNSKEFRKSEGKRFSFIEYEESNATNRKSLSIKVFEISVITLTQMASSRVSLF